MIFEKDEDVERLVKQFEDQTLPKEEWTHAAHLSVALYYCVHHPFGTARNLMRDGIHWLNDAHGTINSGTSGYHETLTVFWLKLVDEFLFRNREEKSLPVLATILVMSYNNSKLPLETYSRERLFSREARMKYLEPDLQRSTMSNGGSAFARRPVIFEEWV